MGDPTFYRSAQVAAAAPPEHLAYVATLNTPVIWFARKPASCLSIVFSTVPYRLSFPLLTTIRMGAAGSDA